MVAMIMVDGGINCRNGVDKCRKGDGNGSSDDKNGRDGDDKMR